MKLVALRFPENRVTYDQWCDWCERVGYDGIDPDYRNRKPPFYLLGTEIPEDLAILFRIEFGL